MYSADAGPPGLAILLFGSAEVRSHGIGISGLHHRKAHWLIALLALREGRAVNRQYLARTLWPPPDRASGIGNARNNLRQSLLHLRTLLGAEAGRIEGDYKTVRLDVEGVFVDVLEFDRAVARGDPASLEHAARLYRGPLLEDCGGAWIVQEREKRRQAYQACLRTLASHSRAAGDFAGAEARLRESIALDDIDFDAHGLLLETLAQAGNYAALDDAYFELCRRLSEAYRRDPPPEIVRLYQRLKTEGARKAKLPVRRLRVATGADHLLHAPRPLTQFVGRESELREVHTRLSTARLLTLTGVAGLGKTRLAQQAAIELAHEYPEGLWFVELAPVRGAEQVIGALIQALAIERPSGVDPQQALIAELRDRKALLVLDNLEQIATGVGAILRPLLVGCPRLRILATSRTPLQIAGEQLFDVPPLSLPARASAEDPEIALESDAVRLFVTASAPGFTLTRGNLMATIELCRRLDALPLAIELAAAQTSVLTVDQILDRLEDRLCFSAGSLHEERHTTLRAALDWSYTLLARPSRELFRRLAVFAGRFDLDAANAAAGDTPARNIDSLRGLIQHSLVRVDTSCSGPAQYWLLETVRQYAREKLARSSEANEVARRHAAWCLTLVERAAQEIDGPEQSVGLNRVGRAYSDVHAALQWAAAKEPETALRLAVALWRFWLVRGYLSDGRRWFDAALCQNHDAAAPLRAKALNRAGVLAQAQGDYRAAQRLHAESLSVCCSVQDEDGQASALNNLGIVARAQRDFKKARRVYRQSLALYRRLGNNAGVAATLCNLGSIEIEQSHLQRANVLVRQSLRLSRERHDRWAIAIALHNLADIARKRHHVDEALRLYAESLGVWIELKDVRAAAGTLRSLGLAACELGHYERSAQLLGAEEAARTSVGIPVSPDDVAPYEDCLLILQSRLDADVFRNAWQSGSAMPFETLTPYAVGTPMPSHA